MNSKLLVAIIAAFLLFPSSAGAVDFLGNGGGPTTSGNCPGCVQGGKVTWYELENAQHSAAKSPGFNRGSGGSGQQKSLRWVDNLSDIRERSSSNNSNRGLDLSWRNATRAVLEASCGTPIRSSQASNCPLWWNTVGNSDSSNKKTWLEVHALRPSGGIGIENQLAGYNVRIWRENPAQQRFDLIFQRQVGVGKQATENPNIKEDSADMTRAWWYGGFGIGDKGTRTGDGKRIGGTFSLPGGSGSVIGAGMIGNGQGHEANCRQNLKQGINLPDGLKAYRSVEKAIGRGRTCFWEGPQMGPNPFNTQKSGVQTLWGPFERKSSLPVSQFGAPKKNNFLGITGRGQRESLRFSWSLGNRGSNQAGFGFSLTGAPGLFYAVQVVGIDTREKIVPIKTPADFTFGVNKGISEANSSQQYFKVFMASALPPNQPEENAFQTKETEVRATLEAPYEVQARELAEVTATLSDDNQIPSSNSQRPNYAYSPVFPRQTELLHFTPQLKYSSTLVAGQPYGPDYIRYRGLSGDFSDYVQPADPLYEPPEINNRPFEAKELNVSRALRLNPSGENEVSWRMAWLQPTLENPCPKVPEFPYQVAKTAWPVQPDSCQTQDPAKPDVFNAWDDLFRARSSWDSHHVIRKIAGRLSEDEKGLVKDQLLRCNYSELGVRPVSEQTNTKYQMLTAGSQTAGSEKASDHNEGYSGTSQYGGTSSFQPCQNTFYPLLNTVTNLNQQEAQGVVDVQGPGGSGAALITLTTNRASVVAPSIVNLDDGNIRGIVSGASYRRGSKVELNFCQQGLPDGSRFRKLANGQEVTQPVTGGLLGDLGCRGYALRFQFERQNLGSEQCLSRPAARDELRRKYNSMSHTAPEAGAYGVDDAKGGQSRSYGAMVGAPYTDQYLPWNANNPVPRCQGRAGYTTVGKWVVDKEPQRGWGKYNAGSRLKNGSYLASFTFNFPSELAAQQAVAPAETPNTGTPWPSTDLAYGDRCPILPGTNVRPGTCWSLKATYQGYSNLIRVSAYRQQAELAGQFVKVYGSKASR